jgi:hypothetical protein
MNRDCPHCGKPISRWRPLRSVRVSQSLLKPRKRIMKCAFCGGLIAKNPHPAEQWVDGMGGFWMLVVAIAWIAAGVRAAAITAAIVLVLVATLAIRARAQSRGWPRYRPYDPAEG